MSLTTIKKRYQVVLNFEILDDLNIDEINWDEVLEKISESIDLQPDEKVDIVSIKEEDIW